MGGIGKNVFTVSNKMRGGSKDRRSSRSISPSTTNLCLERQLKGTFTLDETRTDDIPQVTAEENNILAAPFSKEEVRYAVFQMNTTKLPVWMVSPQNSIRISGISSSLTFSSCLIVFMPTDLTYSDLILGRLSCCQRLRRLNGFSSSDPYVSLMLASRFSPKWL